MTYLLIKESTWEDGVGPGGPICLGPHGKCSVTYNFIEQDLVSRDVVGTTEV